MDNYKGIYTVIGNECKDYFIKISKHPLVYGQKENMWPENAVLDYLAMGRHVAISAYVYDGNKLVVRDFMDNSPYEAVGWIDTTRATLVSPDEFLESLNEPGLEI